METQHIVYNFFQVQYISKMSTGCVCIQPQIGASGDRG